MRCKSDDDDYDYDYDIRQNLQALFSQEDDGHCSKNFVLCLLPKEQGLGQSQTNDILKLFTFF